MKKISYFLLLPLILSCSLDNNLSINTNTNNIKNNFKIKGSLDIQENELSYNGVNTTLNSNEYSGGSMIESNGVIENDDSSLVYSGNWTNSPLGGATADKFNYSNFEGISDIATKTSVDVRYSNNGWLVYGAFKYNDVNYSNYLYRITNQETDINKINYIFDNTNGDYNYPVPVDSYKLEAWSTNGMHLAWKTRLSSDNISYTESKNPTSRIEIPFTGTNISVYQYKNPNMGDCKLEVYDTNNNLVRDLIINNNNSSWKLSKTIINGLKLDNYRLVIRGIDNYRFNFVKAEVLPSIEYKFNGNNIIYHAFTANNMGKVAVTIDNNPSTTEIVDLYDARNIYQDIYSKKDLGTGQHTITIDSLYEKNPSSLGFRINLIKFRARTAVRGTFNGTYLNLKSIKLSSYGKADLYIDGVFNREIDLYSPSTEFFDLEITGLTDTEHSFYIEAKNQKNENSTGTRISFDGYTTNKAEYEFQGVSINYYGTKGPDKGKIDVYLDNEYKGRFDFYNNNENYQKEIFRFIGLSNSTHKLKIIPAGRKYSQSTNYKVNIDYLQMGSTPRVIYSGNDGQNYNIYISYEDGLSQPLKISDGNGNGGSPAIALNGHQAIWTSSDGNNYYVKVGSTTNAFTPYTIDTVPISLNPEPSISQDGTKVVWVKNDSGAKVYIRNSNNSNSPTLISNSSTFNKSPSLSPNGSKVLWIGTSSGNPKVFVRNSDVSDSPNIISGSLLKNAYPSFSYDGSKVVWKGNTSGNYYYIYVGNSNNNGTPSKISDKPVSAAANQDYPIFSPDGNKVSFSSTGNIFIKNSDAISSDTDIQLSEITTTYNAFPTFSYDNTKVAWHGLDESSVSHIYVKNADNTGSVIKISDNTTIENRYPSFSPDGSKITWQGKENGITHIYVRNSNGTGSILKLSANTTENAKGLYEGSLNRYP